MRASIAVTLLSVTLAIPALAEEGGPLVNIQQPAVSKAAAQQPRKAPRRAAVRAPAPRPAAVRQAPAPPPQAPAQPAQQANSSGWSYSLLSRSRSDPPAPATSTSNQTLLAAQAEPAAAGVAVAAAQTTSQSAPATKPIRKKSRRTTRKTAAIAAASPAEKAEVSKDEKPKSKRRSARRSKPREERVASRQTPPMPRAKPVTSDATPSQQSDDTTVGSIEPAPAQQAEEKTASLSDDIKNAEVTWWQNQGNPVVFNFRDCVASFASREAGRNKTSTWADLLIQATESDCRAPFDEMARTLAQRFGESGIEPVMRELIDTTFLPAAKSAAASAPPPPVEAPPLPDIPEIPTQ